ncbi:hypothetical protein [Prosthecobacter sp.]|uniref:DUF7638 domain-containing protein n=1 Tax=Prosthecobacter sp. TaxID=1965333 RepID=UPI00378517E5
MASFFKTYRVTPEGERIDGVFAMAFIHNDQYHLTPIRIYRDGMVDCWTWVTFEEFKEKVRSGWVVTQPPPDASVSIWPLASFTATDASYGIEPEQFIREVADEIEALNGRPTSRDRCLEAWRAYDAMPSEDTKEALRLAYRAVPEHNRKFILTGIDRKDHPLHHVLYSEE